MKFSRVVQDRLNKARAKHPKPFNSKHEGLAVLMEEFEEFKQEVFHGKLNYIALCEELIQTAAMCQRFAEDILEYEHE